MFKAASNLDTTRLLVLTTAVLKVAENAVMTGSWNVILESVIIRQQLKTLFPNGQIKSKEKINLVEKFLTYSPSTKLADV
jgi:hypothetical protein